LPEMSNKGKPRRDEENDDGTDSGWRMRDNWGLPSLGFRSQIFSDMDRWTERMFKTFEDLEQRAEKGQLPANTMYYGYSVTIGPDGKPQIREFGNVKPSLGGKLELGPREPVIETTIDEKQGKVKVVAEMPGVQKDDIKTELTENSVMIKAENGNRKYETTVRLDAPIDPNQAKASFNNGILEITMKMKNPPQQQKAKTTSLKIE
jgi:HSP20 family protein